MTLKRRVHCLDIHVCWYQIEFASKQLNFISTFRQVSCDVVSVCAVRYITSRVFRVQILFFFKLQPNNIRVRFACVLSKHDDIRESHTLAYKPNVHEPPYTIFIFFFMPRTCNARGTYSKRI